MWTSSVLTNLISPRNSSSGTSAGDSIKYSAISGDIKGHLSRTIYLPLDLEDTVSCFCRWVDVRPFFFCIKNFVYWLNFTCGQYKWNCDVFVYAPPPPKLAVIFEFDDKIAEELLRSPVVMLVDPAGSELDVSLELAAGAEDDTTTTLLPGRNGLMYSQKIASALFVCNRRGSK